MDVDLRTEITDIMNLTDSDAAAVRTAKLIRYIIVGVDQPDEDGLMLKFAEHAFSVLPSSNLPRTLAKKFGFKIERRKRVSFGEVERKLFRYEMSEEALAQQTREGMTLGLTNIDADLKFKSTYSVKEGIAVETVNLGLYEGVAGNRIELEEVKSLRTIKRLGVSVDEIVANSEVLAKFLQ